MLWNEFVVHSMKATLQSLRQNFLLLQFDGRAANSAHKAINFKKIYAEVFRSSKVDFWKNSKFTSRCRTAQIHGLKLPR